MRTDIIPKHEREQRLRQKAQIKRARRLAKRERKRQLEEDKK